MWWLSWLRHDWVEPDCNAAVPGSIPASSTVSWGAAGIMTVYQILHLRMLGVPSWVKNNKKKIYKKNNNKGGLNFNEKNLEG
jgi:hypothetical protein